MFDITTTQEKGIFARIMNYLILKFIRTCYDYEGINIKIYSKFCKPDMQNYILISQKWQVGCYVSIVLNIGNMRR